MFLSEGVKQKLHGDSSHFLLGGSEDKDKMHLVNWEMVSSLIAQGGLEIMDLGDMNKFLVTK